MLAARASSATSGGTLRIAIGLPLERFDLFSVEMSRTRIMLDFVLERFLNVDRDGAYTPGVVERAEASPDGRSIELVLRANTWFQPHPCLPGGTSRLATGDDLAYSLVQKIRHANLRIPLVDLDAIRQGEPPSATSIRVDGNKVTLALATPVRFFQWMIADAVLIPHELEGCEDLRNLRRPVGTGPFMFTGIPEGSVVTLQRFAQYTGTARPRVDAVEIRPVDDPVEVLSRVGRGHIDIVIPDYTDWDTLFERAGDSIELRPQFKSLGASTARYLTRQRLGRFGLYVGTGPGPLDDVRVRTALAWAFDRDAIAALVPRSVPTGRFLESRMVGYEASLPGLGLDRERARVLIQGVTLARPLRMGTVNHRKVAAELVREAAEIGLRLEIVDVAPARIAEAMASHEVDMFLGTNYTNTYEREDPRLLEGAVPFDTSQTFHRLNAELLAAAAADRPAIYGRIERMLLEQLPTIPLCWADPMVAHDVFVVGPRVHGFHDSITHVANLRDLSSTYVAP